MKFKTKIVFGADGEDVLEFEFPSVGELEAFLLGMEAASGWYESFLISSDSQIYLGGSEFGLVNMDKLPSCKRLDETYTPEQLKPISDKPSL